MLDVNLKKVRENLQLSQNIIAAKLGIASAQYNTYERGTRKPSADILAKLADTFNININYLLTGQGKMYLSNSQNADAVEIKYYYDEKLANLIKIPEITSIWLDRELVHHVWNKNENDLRCLAMPGDSMNGGNVPLLDGDILIIDTTSTDIRRSGVYAYTTNDDKFLGVNKIILKPDMQVRFDFWNENRQSLVYSPENFKNLKLKVLGKAIRSLSIYKD